MIVLPSCVVKEDSVTSKMIRQVDKEKSREGLPVRWKWPPEEGVGGEKQA